MKNSATWRVTFFLRWFHFVVSLLVELFILPAAIRRLWDDDAGCTSWNPALLLLSTCRLHWFFNVTETHIWALPPPLIWPTWVCCLLQPWRLCGRGHTRTRLPVPPSGPQPSGGARIPQSSWKPWHQTDCMTFNQHRLEMCVNNLLIESHMLSLSNIDEFHSGAAGPVPFKEKVVGLNPELETFFGWVFFHRP